MKRLLCALLCALLLLPLPAAAADAPAIGRSTQKLRVDGREIDCEKYNIDGSNYFKLRDVAMLLTDTAARFAVDYDPERDAAIITTGLPYTPIGGELDPGGDRSAEAARSPQTIIVDGAERRDLTVWNIGGRNFFKLRELGTLLGFGVDYDAAERAALVFSGGTADARTLTYVALRQWVRRSYNTLTPEGGWPVYWRRADFGSGPWRRSGVRWDPGGGALQLVHHGLAASRGGEYYVTLTLSPDSSVHRAELTYYSTGAITATPFYGVAELDAAALRADSVPDFTEIRGWPEDTPEAPRMARLLRDGVIETLALAETLLAEEILPGGGMSVADFGFDGSVLPGPKPLFPAPDPDLPTPFRLWSNDGATFLGVAAYGYKDSIWDPDGVYGSADSALSVMNANGRYGSESSDESAFNPYATHPPMLRDADGGFVCYVSVNEGLTGAYPLRTILRYLLESGQLYHPAPAT